MSKLPLISLFRIVLESKSSKRFLLATIFSFAFSMTVILATVGLMDGFVITLKQALSHSNGDIKFSANDNFFLFNKTLEEKLQKTHEGQYSGVLEIESFAIFDDESKGVLLRGVETKSFSKITGIDFKPLKKGVLIGRKFQDKYKLSIGDEIVLAFPSRKQKGKGGTFLNLFTVDGIVDHGIHEKDMRYIYMEKAQLEELTGYRKGTSNFGILKINNFDYLDEAIIELNTEFRDDLYFQPFWSEFRTLLEAVEMEKFSISLVLQLIVLVAILNVVGFIIFISETKSQEFFMLRALGLSLKAFNRFWYLLLFSIWLISCVLAYGMLIIFNEVILKLPFLKIPGDIYVLGELGIALDTFDYSYVYGLSCLWVFLIGFFTMRRQSKKSLLSGLRQEFA